MNDLQMQIDFDAVSDTTKTENIEPEKKTPEFFTFPRDDDEGMNIVEKLSLALKQLNKALHYRKDTLATFLFECVFINGMNRNEIASLDPSTVSVRIPTAERIRQVTIQLKRELASGERCRMLYGAKLRSDVAAEIKSLKENSVGCFPDEDSVLPNLAKVYPGVAMLLGMNLVGHNTALTMLKNPFAVSDTIPRDVFSNHVLAIYYTLQQEVRPVSRDVVAELFPNHNVMKRINGPDFRLLDLILGNRDLIEKVGENYMLKFDYLTNYQKMARIIYERKSLSYQELVEEWTRRTELPSSMVLTETRRRYPWCVPVGKSKWIYSEDEQKKERVQDVIDRYCHEKVRFYFDDLKKHLYSLGYDMKDASVRSYAMQYCRRLNRDANYFCLTECVKPEEDHLWYSKAHVTMRRRRMKPYYKEVERKVVKAIRHSGSTQVASKELRKLCEPIFTRENVSLNNFYKILSKSNRVVAKVIDGTKYIALK